MTVVTTDQTAGVRDWRSVYETEVYPFVSRPSRYINQELHSIHADWEGARVRVALVFPDVYEVGVSHLGLKILYAVLNAIPGVIAERCYSPWLDAEKLLRDKNIPLCSLENCQPLHAFDIVGFSLQYELCYTNLLNILELGGIPLRSTERHGTRHPLVIAGGNVYSPGPLEPFIDVFCAGDGEGTVRNLADWFKHKVESGEQFIPGPASLAGLVRDVPGLYAPVLYPSQRSTDPARRICAEAADLPGVPWPVPKQTLTSLPVSPLVEAPIVPYCEAIHDRAQIEIMRGCLSGCRFCQAGMITRPLREKSADDVITEAQAVLERTGYEDLTLSSLSSGDYSEIESVLTRLLDPGCGATGTAAVSLPSLRMDSFNPALAALIRRVRKTGFTFAPEAGSERLRRVINKRLTREEILATIRSVYDMGWDLVKIYCMIGLPTETMEDIEELVELITDLSDEAARSGNPRARLNLSVSTFVPKTWTPFQWAGFLPYDEIKVRQTYILTRVPRRVKVSLHSADLSWLEAIFARGDRALADVIETAFKSGCRFDEWGEQLDIARWHAAFKQHGIDPETYLRELPLDCPLPWEVLDCGIIRTFLEREWNKALQGEPTPTCRNGACCECGIQRRYACHSLEHPNDNNRHRSSIDETKT